MKPWTSSGLNSVNSNIALIRSSAMRAVAVTMYLVTGTLNAPEFALALTGLLNAVVVYEVPNTEEG